MAHYKFNMFGAVLWAAVIFAFSGSEVSSQQNVIQQYMQNVYSSFNQCQSQFHLPQEVGQAIISTIFNYTALPPGTPEVQCFISCQLQAAGEMYPNGTIPWDSIAQGRTNIFSTDDYNRLLQTVQTCRNTDSNCANCDICQIGYDTTNCYYTNVRQLGLTTITQMAQ